MALEGWYYSKDITIQGSSDAEPDFQVLLKVGESSGSSGCDFHLSGHSARFPSGKNDGGDLRFTDLNDNLLPFWVQKVEGVSPNRVAYVWVKVSADLSSDQTIRCYYGNSNASNVSDGNATFEFFYDFSNKTSLDKSIWTMITGTWNVSGKLYVSSSSGGYPGNIIRSNYILGNNTITAISVHIPTMSSGVTDVNTGTNPDSGYTGHERIGIASIGISPQKNEWGKANGSWTTADQGSFTVTEDETITMELKYVNGNGTIITKYGDYTHSLTQNYLAFHIGANIGTNFGIFYVYNRKYVDPEPSFKSAGAEVYHGSKLSGTVCDKNGNPITGKAVDIAFLNKDTKELLHTCQSNSNDGTWTDDQIPANPNTKVLAVFGLEGSYNGDTDIAGAEFTTTEQT